MKPIIGVTSSKELGKEKYHIQQADTEAIIQAGGLPIMLPHLTNEDDIDQIAERIDGLYATGGYDVDPTLFGEEPHPNLGTVIPSRDAFELALIQKVLELDKPILGVCRGTQILNVAVGGDMYQDIPTQIEGNVLQHQQKAPSEHGSHFVDVKEGSLLHRLTESEKLKVNSRHHQANRSVPESFLISGTASDGVVEAIESKEHHFVLGLQWHPENMAVASDIPSQKIFKGFIEACLEEEDN
jgi:putative glutamine amidotransferase